MRQEVDHDSFAASPLTADAEELPMNANRFEPDLIAASFASSASWTDVNPHSHLLQFYEDDRFLIDTLTQWFAHGLSGEHHCLGLGSASYASLSLEVCAPHRPRLPAESYSALTTEAERLRAISLLQHKASVLETEKAGRKKAEQSLFELEQILKIRLAELAQADQRTNEFLAMLGHELRNPLSAVLDAIATAQLDQTRRDRALTIARRQTDQLAGLVDDLLDVGRITQGRITLKKETIKVGNVLKQAVEEAQCLVEPGQHRLSVRISSGAEEAVIEGAPARLLPVIAKLIHNPVEFPSAARRSARLCRSPRNADTPRGSASSSR